MSSPNSSDTAAIGIALRILDDAWEEVRRSAWVALQLGLPPHRLPDVSQAEAERRAQVGRALIKRVDLLDLETFPGDIGLSLRLVRHRAGTWAREADWYWLACDPVGVGFFGMFLPTAYCGGALLNVIHGQLAAFRFEEVGDLDRYLALTTDYARLVGQMAIRTQGQADRGIRMPRAQVLQAHQLLAAMHSRCRDNLGVKDERLAALAADAFLRELERRLAREVQPAFEQALAALSGDYLARAPEAVGLGQYPGGAAVYADLVKLHTTLDLTPEAVSARGLQRIAQIEAEMREIREGLGFADPTAFLAHIESAARFHATTIEGVKAVFQRYVDRIGPHLPKYFHAPPATACTIAPLPEALQGSMTFGYYDAPRRERPTGMYLFNAQNLTRRSLFNIGALTYHELIPGHHLHFSTQQANAALHPVRAHSFFNAYNEGWAEYAAALAGEIGMYETPEERYGRLTMDAFLSCRLVVDTGTNALGWSLEQAREYLRAHSGMGEPEICSETLRYSCDIPAQSLAYKLGDVEILAMRERMRIALGADFDIRDFHAAVLGPGALPLPELARHVERETTRLKSEERAG